MNRSNFRSVSLLLLIPFAVNAFSATHVNSQDSTRNIDHPGDFQKLLTPGLTDYWIFEGKKDETIIVQVATDEFDAVLQLVQTIGEKDKALNEVDDVGSDCRMMFRLPEDGKYKVCVHGFEFRGGGNYTFSLRQYQACPKEFGTRIEGKFDRDGNANFYFEADEDQSLTVDAQGRTLRSWAVVDTFRNPIGSWERFIKLDRKGVWLIELNGQGGQPFELTLRPVLQHHWTEDKTLSGALEPRQAMIIDFDGKSGESRMIELATPDGMNSQLVFAPTAAEKGERLDCNLERPVSKLLPVANKGNFTRYAVIWGRTARYQMWIYTERGGNYTVQNSELTTSVAANQTRSDQLAVGGTRFYRIQPEQVQSFIMKTRTNNFDPVVNLFDHLGNQLASDDDGLDGLNSRLIHTAFNTNPLLLSVASMGNGGGGEYELDIRIEESSRLELNKKQTNKSGEVGIDHWSFAGKKGQTVIFHASSERNLPNLLLRDSRGALLAQSSSNGDTKDSVMLCKFRSDGEYSLWVTAPNGEEYSLKALDADQ